MMKTVLLVLAFLFATALLSQAQSDAGFSNVKTSSALPQEPAPVSTRSTTATCGCIRVLTFEDVIPTPPNTRLAIVPNGYGGLIWTNVQYLNTTYQSLTYGWNGYITGRTSGQFIAFNGYGLSMSMNVPNGQYFQLNSMSLAAAWNSNLMVTIKGTRGNVLIYQTIVQLQVTSKTTLYTLKWIGVDKITFSSSGGTPYPGLRGAGTHFAVDDIDITI